MGLPWRRHNRNRLLVQQDEGYPRMRENDPYPKEDTIPFLRKSWQFLGLREVNIWQRWWWADNPDSACSAPAKEAVEAAHGLDAIETQLSQSWR